MMNTDMKLIKPLGTPYGSLLSHGVEKKSGLGQNKRKVRPFLVR
jgi:hypothetical protein